MDRIGVADDFYFVGDVRKLDEHWEDFEARSAEAGFVVRRSKCKCLVPYLDARELGLTMGYSHDDLVKYDQEVAEATGRFEAKVQRSKGALPLLGTVAHGKAEVLLGPFQPQTQPAVKRATEAMEVIGKIPDYILRTPHGEGRQAAWTVMQQSM